jgi:hypothetical protein
MPKVLPFVLVKKLESKDEYDAYKDMMYDYSISNTKWATCNSCDIASHTMKIQYAECTNAPCKAKGGCNAKFRIHSCNQDQIEIYQYGEHTGDFLKSDKSSRGLSNKTKEVIENIINVSVANNIDCKPKRILYKLQMSKYKNSVDSLPSLKKIQTYMSNHRCREKFAHVKSNKKPETKKRKNTSDDTDADLHQEAASTSEQASNDGLSADYLDYYPIKVEIFTDDDDD